MDLSKFSMFFLPFSKKNKLKFDHDFKACWSFCFELKVLNESKYSMSWVRCAFGNIYNIHYPCKRAGSKIHHKNYEDVPCHSLHIASHSRIVQLVLFPVWYMCKIMFTLNSEYIINTKYSQPLIFLAACIHQIKENCLTGVETCLELDFSHLIESFSFSDLTTN